MLDGDEPAAEPEDPELIDITGPGIPSVHVKRKPAAQLLAEATEQAGGAE
jgi:hypothetical protein